MDEFCGHKSGVTCAAFNQDYLLTAGYDNQVLVYSLENSKARRKLRQLLGEEFQYSLQYNAYHEVLDAKKQKKAKKPAAQQLPLVNPPQLPKPSQTEKSQAPAKPTPPAPAPKTESSPPPKTAGSKTNNPALPAKETPMKAKVNSPPIFYDDPEQAGPTEAAPEAELPPPATEEEAELPRMKVNKRGKR